MNVLAKSAAFARLSPLTVLLAQPRQGSLNVCASPADVFFALIATSETLDKDCLNHPIWGVLLFANRIVVAGLHLIRQLLLFLAAHLHFEAFGIRNVKTAFGGPDLQPAPFQLGFNSGLHIFVGVPTGNCVSDVIYFAGWGPIANDENVVAE